MSVVLIKNGDDDDDDDDVVEHLLCLTRTCNRGFSVNCALKSAKIGSGLFLTSSQAGGRGRLVATLKLNIASNKRVNNIEAVSRFRSPRCRLGSLSPSTEEVCFCC